MPDEDIPNANIYPQQPAQDAQREGLAAPPFLHHHGPGIADSTTATILPPALTPETTTRQSVSFGVLSSLWGASLDTSNSPNIPSITTTAVDTPSSEPSSLLTGSTLPPGQSAALRALNAPAFHSPSSIQTSRPAKSTSSHTSLSSQPVVVRTYSGPRHESQASSRIHSPRPLPNMNESTTQHTGHRVGTRHDRLPAVEDFSFSNILRAVDPEIREAIDAIAQICARSRLSLAGEYDAHLPPQGEIVTSDIAAGWGATTLAGRGRLGRVAGGWAAENTLTAVPEASSSSERLAGESRGSVVSTGSGKGKTQSAYGSLKSVISGDSKAAGKQKRKDETSSSKTDENPGVAGDAQPTASVSLPSTHPFKALVSSPTTSNQLSYDFSSSHTKDTAAASFHRRHTSVTSLPPSRARSGSLASLSAWITWGGRIPSERPNTALGGTKAETKLKEMLSAGH